MPYCIHCGTLNPDAAKFCSNCGSTMVSKTAAPPSTQQTQSTPQAYSQSSTPVQTNFQRPVTTPAPKTYAFENLKSPAFGGAILVLLGFFLPWFPNYTGYYSSGSINGTGFVKSFVAALSQLNSEDAKAIGVIFTVLIYLIPISAGIFLLNSLLSSRINGLVRLMRYLPFLIFLLFILLIIIASSSQGSTPSFSGFKIGIYMCLIGSIIMLSLRRTF